MAKGPVALAGIMGGENSEIQPETVDILLESAYFNPTAIRRTSKRLGIHTESSHRFERGADINMVPIALDRATALILDLAGGKVAADGRIDVYPQAAETATPDHYRTAHRGNSRAASGWPGNSAAAARASAWKSKPPNDPEEALYVTVPSFRHDLEREIDLIEEVARLNGYDRIPVTMPASRALCHPLPDHLRLVRRTRNLVSRNRLRRDHQLFFCCTRAMGQVGTE